ncbi:hypothetical protein ACFPC0_10595 [Streptomyces andamanensis]|uniref:Uncharacterized protein n=1 Tax=Streptomyces andamanensis TaxID=1565035 RepID=A0ABV8TCF2_9ACTN
MSGWAGLADVDTFRFGVYAWNVTLAAQLAQGEPVRHIDPADCRAGLAMVYVDEEHARTVDLSEPVLLAAVPELNSIFPIDGWHRVWRALDEGVRRLPCRLLTAEQELQARVYGGEKGLPPRTSLAERAARRAEAWGRLMKEQGNRA